MDRSLDGGPWPTWCLTRPRNQASVGHGSRTRQGINAGRQRFGAVSCRVLLGLPRETGGSRGAAPEKGPAVGVLAWSGLVPAVIVVRALEGLDVMVWRDSNPASSGNGEPASLALDRVRRGGCPRQIPRSSPSESGCPMTRRQERVDPCRPKRRCHQPRRPYR
jgi:hypothetical protein